MSFGAHAVSTKAVAIFRDVARNRLDLLCFAGYSLKSGGHARGHLLFILEGGPSGTEAPPTEPAPPATPATLSGVFTDVTDPQAPLGADLPKH
jgi:hypothetical protein